MAIPLAHLLISTLELAARISPTLCCQRITVLRLNPPCPPQQAIKRKLVQKPSWAFSCGVVRPISFQLLGNPKKNIKFKQNLPFSIWKSEQVHLHVLFLWGESSDFACSQKFLTSSSGSDLEKHFWCQVNPIWPLKTSHSIQLFSKLKKKSSLKLWEISGRPPISWWLLVGVKSKIVAFSVERILPLDRMITTYMCTEKNHEKIVYW